MPINDNGDGTVTVTDATPTDNHDGTATLGAPYSVVNNGDGTVTATTTNNVWGSSTSFGGAPTPPPPVLLPIAVHAGAGDMTTYQSQNTGGVVLAKPANVADKDVLIAYVYAQTASATTPPAGWTQLFDVNAIGGRAGGVWAKEIPTASAETATSYQFTLGTASRGAGLLFRVTGANLASLLDVASSTSPSYLTAGATLPSITTTNPGDLILNFIWTNDSSQVTGITFSDSFGSSDVGPVWVVTGNNSAIDVFFYVQGAAGPTPSNDVITRNTTPVNGKVFSLALNANPQSVSLTGAWGSVSSMGANAQGPIEADAGMTSVSSMSTTGQIPRINPSVFLSNPNDFTWNFSAQTAQVMTGTKPANTVDGDTLIALVVNQTTYAAGQDMTGPTPNVGTWQRLGPLGEVHRAQALWALEVPSAAALTDTAWTWTIPSTAGRWGVLIFRVRDLDQATLLDAASLMAAGTTTITTSSFTTTVPNDLLLLVAHNTGTSAQRPVTFTDPSGYTRQFYEDTGGSGSYDGAYVAASTAPNAGTSETVSLPITPAQSAYAGFLVALRGRVASNPAGTAGWTSVSSMASAAKSTAPSMDAVSISAMGFSPNATTAAATAMRSVSGFTTAFLNPVQAFMRNTPMYVAHRGGDSDWVQDTANAYAHSVAWSSKLALEVSLIPTSDGYYMLSDTTTTDAVFGTTNNDIRTQTKAQLKTLRSTVGGFPPMFFDEDILPVYAQKRVIFIDNKLANNVSAMLDLMDANGGPSWWIVKAGGTGNAWSTPARARGYEVWKYWFPSDTSTGNFNATTVADCTLIGLQYNDTTAVYTQAKTYGKPLLSHIIASQAQATQAIGQGATGLMVSGIMEVVPADASLGGMVSVSAFAGTATVKTGNVAGWGSSSSMSGAGRVQREGDAAMVSHSAFAPAGTRITFLRTSMLSSSSFPASQEHIVIPEHVTFRSVSVFGSHIAVTVHATIAMRSVSAFAGGTKRITGTTAHFVSTTHLSGVTSRRTAGGSRMTSVSHLGMTPASIVAAVAMRSQTSLKAAAKRTVSGHLGFTSVSHLGVTPGHSITKGVAVFRSVSAFGLSPSQHSSLKIGMFSHTAFAAGAVLDPTAHWKSVILWDPPINVIFLESLAWLSSSVATFYAAPVSIMRPFPFVARLRAFSEAHHPLTATLAPQPTADAGDFT